MVVIEFGYSRHTLANLTRAAFPMWRWLDKPTQIIYRCGYPLLVLIWRIMKYPSHGVQVAVWSGSRVLLVRASYRDEYSFPGGEVRNGESPIRTAGRELMEEAGVRARTNRMKLVFDRQYRRCDIDFRDQIFEYRSNYQPSVSIDNREIVEAGFFNCHEALRMPLCDSVRRYLLNVRSEC